MLHTHIYTQLFTADTVLVYISKKDDNATYLLYKKELGINFFVAYLETERRKKNIVQRSNIGKNCRWHKNGPAAATVANRIPTTLYVCYIFIPTRLCQKQYKKLFNCIKLELIMRFSQKFRKCFHFIKSHNTCI